MFESFICFICLLVLANQDSKRFQAVAEFDKIESLNVGK